MASAANNELKSYNGVIAVVSIRIPQIHLYLCFFFFGSAKQQVISQLLIVADHFGPRVVMVSSMKSSMGFFYLDIKLLGHHPLQILFILIRVVAMVCFTIQMRELLKLLVKMKTILPFYQIQFIMERDKPISVCVYHTFMQVNFQL